MEQNKSNGMRLISIALTVMFLLVSVMASTESVSAASKLKITAAKKRFMLARL